MEGGLLWWCGGQRQEADHRLNNRKRCLASEQFQRPEELEAFPFS